MRLIFIHQNLPGQFRHVAARLATEGGHDMVFLGTRGDRKVPGARVIAYRPHRAVSPNIHPYLVRTEQAVLFGQAAARALVSLRDGGFRPDLILAHSGWGESLFVKDVYPSAPLLVYSEFFYRARGADVGFEAEQPLSLDVAARTRMRGTNILQSLMACERALTPTDWQKSVHPPLFHPLIDVIHEGIDTDLMKPDPDATLTVGGGVTVSAKDEVITYVARNLEPYRGFHVFMRALPAILEARPSARVLVVGGDDVSYGALPTVGGSWREALTAEVSPPPDRVFFLGRVPYDTFRRILQVSSVHVYLTYPFVLSWSMLEAMSCGCLVVGSDTPPVREVIRHGETGLLTPFQDPEALARVVIDTLARGAETGPLRDAARRTVIEHYNRPTCLDRQLALFQQMVHASRR